MKKLVIAILSFLAIFYTIRSITCPTCVGLSKEGQRPFFEHNNIVYTQYKNSCPEHDKKSDNNSISNDSLEDEEC